jgi:general stress protein 26
MQVIVACLTPDKSAQMEDAHVDQSTYRQQQLSKVDELIRDIPVAMLTTADDDGSLRSRPMAARQAAFDGNLWFFTRADAPKVDELQQHPQVNVSFADPERQYYVSVSGTATLVHDRQKMEELWSPRLRTWFPQGLEGPNLALLQVHADTVEYWDAPSSTMVQLLGVVKATLTGESPQPGEHAKLVVDERQAGP